MFTSKPVCLLALEPDVSSRLGLKKSALLERTAKGLFIRGIRLNDRVVRYPSNEVDAIVQAHIAGLDDEALKALVTRLHDARKLAAANLTAIAA